MLYTLEQLSPRNIKGTALVADSDPASREQFQKLLRKNGFKVILAENGKQAINYFSLSKPDIVFIAMEMSIMDGIKTIATIKSMVKDDFIPIIFITDQSKTEETIQGIESGADDFINKPVNELYLKAKIHSLERIRKIHTELNKINEEVRHEQEIAEHIFEEVVNKSNVEINNINVLFRSADVFSGDMLLTAYTPSRETHILLADFTGHGLSAAIGAIPASEVFHAMTRKGFSSEEVLDAINKKLCRLLPANLFMAAQYITISNDLKYISACNCGMPDILILDGKQREIKHRFISKGMPLGITSSVQFSSIIERHNISYNDRVILSSDGVIEAMNIDGEQFGQHRFEQALLNAKEKTSEDSREYFNDFIYIFDSFCQGAPQNDDISLVDIPCTAENLPAWDMQTVLQTEHNVKVASETEPPNSQDYAEISLYFNANNLKQTDPVPLVINHIEEFSANPVPRQSLFVILTELYINALDHGILGLDSSLKSTAEGFTTYFNEREKRLASIHEAYIRIRVRIFFHEQGGKLEILVEDSGPGFDFEKHDPVPGNENTFSGRGIALVRQFCSSVTYFAPGNRVKAVYQWENDEIPEENT